MDVLQSPFTMGETMSLSTLPIHFPLVAHFSSMERPSHISHDSHQVVPHTKYKEEHCMDFQGVF